MDRTLFLSPNQTDSVKALKEKSDSSLFYRKRPNIMCAELVLTRVVAVLLSVLSGPGV